MEWHEGHFESDADDDHHRRRHRRQRRNLPAANRFRDFVKIRLAGETEQQTETVQHDGRSKRAEEEILEAGFGGFVVVAQESGENVQADGSGFQGEIEHHQIGGGGHEVHADHTADQNSVVFAFAPDALHVKTDERGNRARKHEDDAE